MQLPNTYTECRARFRDEFESQGARLTAYANPIEEDALYTDVAELGPADATQALVVISGTHGVEGFCGSMCQRDALAHGLFSHLPARTKIVLIHALNPYGFARIRRTNEDNVDLNRNFVDHRQPLPRNDGYDELHEALFPVSLTGFAAAQSSHALNAFAISRGPATFQKAVSAGQYHHSTGLFYGGQRPTWSRRTLRAICRKHLGSTEIIWTLDYHTGLGPFAALELILTDSKGSPMHTRAARVFGSDRVKVIGGPGADSVSSNVVGSIDECFASTFEDAELTYLALEYGIKPIPEVLDALITENWHHHRGDPSSAEYQASKQKLLEVFWSPSPEWQSRVCEQSRQVVTAILAHLSN
ncbi:MAG TPA: M14 family metallopeptidase [Bryobacteraceae bacterium]|jgi:hypothetical protein